MIHHIFQERNVGFHAANAEFTERPVHALTSLGKIRTPSCDLDEQRIVVRGERGSGVSGSAVQANTEARRRAVGRKLSVVGSEIVCGIFCGHAALQCRTVQRHRVLLGQGKRWLLELVILRDQDLRSHQVDAGHHFCNRVLDLNARVHFDEIPFLRIHIVEKFHRAGIAVFRLTR